MTSYAKDHDAPPATVRYRVTVPPAERVTYWRERLATAEAQHADSPDKETARTLAAIRLALAGAEEAACAAR